MHRRKFSLSMARALRNALGCSGCELDDGDANEEDDGDDDKDGGLETLAVAPARGVLAPCAEAGLPGVEEVPGRTVEALRSSMLKTE